MKAAYRTHEQFIEEMKNKNPTVEVLGEYIDTKHKVLVRCRKCRREWQGNPTVLLRGHACSSCSHIGKGGKRALSQAEYEEKIKSKNENIIVAGQYTGARVDTLYHCSKCGSDWQEKPRALKEREYRCPCCEKKAHIIRKRSGKKQWNRDTFVERLQSIDSNIDLIGEYRGCKEPVRLRCKKCGHEWTTRTNNISKNVKHLCPSCRKDHRMGIAKKLSKTHEQFLTDLHEQQPTITVIDGTYVNCHSQLTFRCADCGHEWKTAAQSVIGSKRTGCAKCTASGTSFMEQFIGLSLKKILGEDAVLTRNRRVIGKELDIYLPDYALAIEPGSWFWHKDKIEKDLEKKRLCAEKGIELLIVYDFVPAGSDVHANADIISYETDLGSEPGNATLKAIVRDLCSKIGQKCSFSQDDWDEISEKANLLSKRMNHERFVEAMEKINPNIEILGRFTGRYSKIRTRCRTCGHTWNVQAASLLAGHDCKKCAYKRNAENQTFTHDDFVEIISERFPEVEIVGIYTNCREQIKFRCRVCGHEWEAKPYLMTNSRRKHGCPQCYSKNRGKALRLSPEEYAKRVEKNNPDIELISEYVKQAEKIKVRCRRCGASFEAWPRSIEQGNACHDCQCRK